MGKLDELLDNLKVEKTGKKCKGVFFRGYIEKNIDGLNLEWINKLEIDKELSCEGCEECYGYHECISEGFEYDNLILPEEIEDGVLYGVTFEEERDWETGQVCDCIIEIVKIKEK